MPRSKRFFRPLRAARNAAQRIYDTRVEVAHLQRSVASLAQEVADRQALLEALGRTQSETRAALFDALDQNQSETREMLGLLFYDDSGNRERLWQARRTAEYAQAFEDPEPLVSICIATYSNTELLMERALPSILSQTYERLEVVIVGDAAGPEVERAVKSVGDSRVRYSNQTVRGPYPQAAPAQWLVAGGPPRNEAMRLSRGRWIATMDDDDESTPDRIEVLLRAARSRNLEFCYGQIERRDPNGTTTRLCEFPPAQGHVGLQAAIMHADLRFITAELGDAVFGLPGDWSRIRRMMRIGVRMGTVNDTVLHYYPGQLWGVGSGREEQGRSSK